MRVEHLLVAAAAAALSWSCAVLEPEEAGSFSLVFQWAEPPEETVFLWARVEDRSGPEATTQASAGPVAWSPGGEVDLELSGVTNGGGKVVVVEVREEESTAARIVAYGASEPFSLVAGKHVVVEVGLVLAPPAPDAFGAEVSITFGGEERAVANAADVQAAEVTTRTRGAVSLTVANDFAFAAGKRQLVVGADSEGFSCVEEEVSGDGGGTVDVCTIAPWDLTEGLPGSSPATRTVFVKFEDAAGYESGVYSATVVVDEAAPVAVQVSLAPSLARAGQEVSLVVTASEVVPPGQALLEVLPAGGPTFAGPEALGPSVLRWTAAAPIEDDPTTYTFLLSLADAAGNAAPPVPLLDAAGADVALRFDAIPPALADSPPVSPAPALFGIEDPALPSENRVSFEFAVVERLPPPLPAAEGPCAEPGCPSVLLEGKALGAVSRRPFLDLPDEGVLGFAFEADVVSTDWGAVERDVALAVSFSDLAGNAVELPLPEPIHVDFVPPAASCAVSPSGRPAGAGEPISLTVTTSESLAPGFPSLEATGVSFGPAFAAGLATSTFESAGVAPGKIGTFNLAVSLRDLAGNESLACTLGGTFDGVAPAIVPGSASVSDPNFRPGEVVELAFAVTETLAALPEVHVDGTPAPVTGGADPLAFVATWTVPEGSVDHVLSIVVTLVDTAQNVVSDATAFPPVVVDATPPTIECQFVQPSPSVGLGEILVVNCPASETLAGPPSVTFSGLEFAEGTIPPNLWTFTSKPVPAGAAGVAQLTLLSIADVAGHVTAGDPPSGILTLVKPIDGVFPSIVPGSVSHGPTDLKEGDVATIGFDTTEGVSTPDVRIGGVQVPHSKTGGTSWTFELPVTTALGEGPKPVAVTLVDAAGNQTVDSTSFPAFTFDFTPPSAVCSVTPAGRPAGKGETIVLSVVASEPLASGFPVLDAPGAGFSVASSSGPSTTWVATAPAGGEPASFAWTVSLTDLAGNPSPAACQDEIVVDPVLPDVVSGTAFLSAAFYNEGDLLEGGFEVSEPLAGEPLVVVGTETAAVAAQGAGYTFSLPVASALGAGTKVVAVTLVDLAGNTRVVTDAFGAVTFDFEAPGIASASVAYVPSFENPLPKVAAATTGTEVTVVVFASEPIDPAMGASLTASNGEATLHFDLVPGSVTSGGASFRLEVPDVDGEGNPVTDGAYVPEVVWTDLAGNTGAASSPGTPILVDRTAPILEVDQDALTFVRSPWGGLDDEDLGGHVVPAGPSFSLAPADPLSAATSLPAATFLVDGGKAPVRLRVWQDADVSTPLATLDPGPGGAGWPRAALPLVDVETVWLSGLDPAGNESERVAVAHVEWVATSLATKVSSSPHRLLGVWDTRASFEPDPAVSKALDLSLPIVAGAKDVSLAGQPQAQTRGRWWERDLAPDAPAPRQGGRLAWDARRHVAVLFGGSALGTDAIDSALDDTWEWDGRRWTESVPSAAAAPGGRSHFAMCWDSWHGRVLMQGGRYYDGFALQYHWDTWEWDGDAWTKPPGLNANNTPHERSNHAMAFDPVRGRAVLYGGVLEGTGGTQSDTWEWDGEAWKKVGTGGAPGARFDHAMAWDGTRGRVVLFGGRGLGGVYKNDLWEWDGAAWTLVTPQGSSPSVRSMAGLVWDPEREVLVLLGGFASSGAIADVWEWDGVAWTKVTAVGDAFSKVGALAAGWDGESRRVLVFGGASAGGTTVPTDGTWLWDGEVGATAWPLAGVPAARSLMSIGWDEARQRIVVHGGTGDSKIHSDVWEWNGWRWSPRSVSSGPGAVYAAAHAWDPATSRFLVHGGLTTGSNLAFPDTWGLGSTWSNLFAASKSPSPFYRYLAGGAAGPEGPVYLMGGQGYNEANFITLLGDLWSWDGSKWTKLAGNGVGPKGRMGAVVGYDRTRDELVVYGGMTQLLIDAPKHSETWTWNGLTWKNKGSHTGPFGKALTAHGWHGGHEAVVFTAGIGDATQITEGFFFAWDGNAWSQEGAITQFPSERYSSGWAWDERRGVGVLMAGRDHETTFDDLWEHRAGGDVTPALQLVVTLAGQPFSTPDVESVLVRARCAGRHTPYGPADTGASLLAWRTGGEGGTEGWTELGGHAAAFPLGAGAGAGAGTWLDDPWTLSASFDDPAEIARLVLARDLELGFQVRTAGPQGPVGGRADVHCDRFETRIRYLADSQAP